MHLQLTNLFGVVLVAFAVPFVLGFFPAMRVPSAAVELLIGILIGPAVLGWVEPGLVVSTMSSLGVAFLLFLAGMELDLRQLRGAPLRLGALGFLASLAIAFALTLPLGAKGIILSALLVTIALCATSVGIVVPVLRDTGQLKSPVGLFTLAGGSFGEVGTIALLGVFFAGHGAHAAVAALLFAIVAVCTVLLFVTLRTAARWELGQRIVDRLDDTSAQMRVRFAMLILIGRYRAWPSTGYERDGPDYGRPHFSRAVPRTGAVASGRRRPTAWPASSPGKSLRTILVWDASRPCSRVLRLPTPRLICYQPNQAPRGQSPGQRPARPFVVPGLTMYTTDDPLGGAGAETSAATGALDQARSGAVPSDLPLTLLAAGYHLRQINAVRARFDGRAERVALPVLLWLAARLADPDPGIAHAAAAVLQGLALATQPIPRGYSLRELGDATGFPRETLRRTARQLKGFGWILDDTEGQLSVTPRFTDYLWADGESERLQDFRWTVARLRELSDPATAAIGASVTEALAAMGACRGDELPQSIRWAIPATLAGAPLAAAMVYLTGYNLRHLLQIAPHFDGDLLQVVLLGELAHRNIAALAPGAAKRDTGLAAVLKVDQPRDTLLNNPQRAFNAYSLASCLGVPYETTRRKLTQLCTRGWVARDERGLYWVLPNAADYFQQFNLDRRADMLATAATIEALLQSPAPPARSTACPQ